MATLTLETLDRRLKKLETRNDGVAWAEGEIIKIAHQIARLKTSGLIDSESLGGYARISKPDEAMYLEHYERSLRGAIDNLVAQLVRP